jgi:hypothetical protein
MAGVFRRKSLTWVIEIARKPIRFCVLLLDRSGPLGLRTPSGCAVVAASQMPKPTQRPDIRADVAFTLPKLLVHHSAAQIAILIVRDFRQTDGCACDG